MRDQPLTVEQAARWLDCPVDDVRAFLQAGRLRPYAAGAGEGESVSLNSVVVLAESLPADRGIFRVRDSGGGDHHGGGYGQRPPPGGRPHGERPTFVVERRSTSPRRV